MKRFAILVLSACVAVVTVGAIVPQSPVFAVATENEVSPPLPPRSGSDARAHDNTGRFEKPLFSPPALRTFEMVNSALSTPAPVPKKTVVEVDETPEFDDQRGVFIIRSTGTIYMIDRGGLPGSTTFVPDATWTPTE